VTVADVQLYLGDCLDVLKTLDAGSVDAVVTDPPYANGTEYGLWEDTQERLAALVTELMPQVRRVSRRALITCGVANVHLYPPPDWILSWFTPAGAGSSRWGFCCWQPILAYGRDPYLAAGLGRRPDAVNLTRRAEKNGHPCPKPIEFMRWLIERATLKGETVLDPFMGSGTTGVACVQTGRNFIGIEIDEGYFKIAERRIAEAQLQIPLPLAAGATP
jgi:site-specific DNA-methyltransferase (adenine-specific)/modification methylase